jgi:redox-sensitive bicupin YhaK (pirin superfamily)
MCGAELNSIRPVAQVLPMPWHAFDEGSGAWMLHPQDRHALDPVVLVDHFVMPTPAFAPHPHAGFSAVTYLFEDGGGVRNRDSLGDDRVIGPGALHWTQAGRGMLHEEIPAVAGVAAHGLQLFVNSRAIHKDAPPAVFHLRADEVPVVALEGGVQVRVARGEFAGQRSQLPAHTGLTLLDVKLPANTSAAIPIGRGQRAFAIVVSGALATPDGEVPEHHAVRYADEGAALLLQAGGQATQVVVLAGEPIGEPLVPRGPFIANTAEQALDMIRRFQRGEMGSLEATPMAVA